MYERFWHTQLYSQPNKVCTRPGTEYMFMSMSTLMVVEYKYDYKYRAKSRVRVP